MEFVTFVLLCSLINTIVESWVEVPKFSQMKLIYPGYHKYGGKYKDNDIYSMISDNVTYFQTHDTASLRMSYLLNRYGGRHSIGNNVIRITKHKNDSIVGRDGNQYIFRNTAFGPFLAHKYGNPQIIKLNITTKMNSMTFFMGKRGIIRLVSFNEHPGGHIALWDCDSFFQSKNWSQNNHIISIELWESPDSYCPSPMPFIKPKLVQLNKQMSDEFSKHNYSENFRNGHDIHRLRHRKTIHD